MRAILSSLIPLFVSCFILFLGNGLINTLLPVRMGLDGISTDTIGLVLSLNFVGMLFGALYSKNLIIRVGHIRMFAGSVALMSAGVLVLSLQSDMILWGGVRIIIGFCFACVLTAMESWLSDQSTPTTRGKILAIYNAAILGGLFGGQFFMGVADPSGTTLFTIGAILFSFALIPLVMGRSTGPVVNDVTPMSLLTLIKVSPLGVAACIVSGMIYAAFFNLLPVVAKGYGFADFTLSAYMATAILSAFILQFPIGYFSDRFDRRTVLLILLLISSAVDFIILRLSPDTDFVPLFVLTGMTSGIIACIYPLSIAQTFDQLRQSEMVAAMASMILAFSIGGALGPYSASLVMAYFDPNTLFYYLGCVQLGLAAFVVYRMMVRDALPVADQESFVMQSEATVTTELDPRTEYPEDEDDQTMGAEAETAMQVAENNPAAAVKLAQTIAPVNPAVGAEVAAAVSSVEGVDVLRLYEAMNKAVPEQILTVTAAIVQEQPQLACELVERLSQNYPDQVLPVLIEMGRVLPEQRIDMAEFAAETAPESATEVAQYYLQLEEEEQAALRPADRDNESDEQHEETMSQLIDVIEADFDDTLLTPEPKSEPNLPK